MVRRGHPSDVSDIQDEGRRFVLPYLLLCREDSGKREHDLREVFNAVPYVAKTAVHGDRFWPICRLGPRFYQ